MLLAAKLIIVSYFSYRASFLRYLISISLHLIDTYTFSESFKAQYSLFDNNYILGTIRDLRREETQVVKTLVKTTITLIIITNISGIMYIGEELRLNRRYNVQVCSEHV